MGRSAVRWRRRGGAVVLGACALVAGACSSGGEVSTAPTSAPSTTVDPKVTDALSGAAGRGTTTVADPTTIADVDFADFTYAPDSCGDDTERQPFEATDGTASTPSGATLSVLVDGIAYGDVTGDGEDEAVVLVTCNAGGNASWTVPLVYGIGQGGGVERLGILDAPDRDDRAVQSASISDGQIVTDEVVFLPDDPRCCPSATGATIWEWDGTAFVVVNATEAGGPDDGGSFPDAGPTKSGSSDPFLITPDGVGPFYLGMTADELAAHGVSVVPSEPGCGTSAHDAVGTPDGLHLLLDDVGSVRAISVSSPAYLTDANANVDSFDFDLQAVYPGIEYADFGADIGGQFIVAAPDRSSAIFFNVFEGEVGSITVTWGDSGFMDLC